MKILEQRNALFDGITTGALVGTQLYFVANSQLDKVSDGRIKPGAKVNPLQIMKLNVQPSSVHSN